MKPFTTTRINHACPVCGSAHDAFSGPGHPEPGVLVLCVECFCWLTFETTGLRKVTDGEWMTFPMTERRRLTGIRDDLKAFQARRRAQRS